MGILCNLSGNLAFVRVFPSFEYGPSEHVVCVKIRDVNAHTTQTPTPTHTHTFDSNMFGKTVYYFYYLLVGQSDCTRATQCFCLLIFYQLCLATGPEEWMNSEFTGAASHNMG